MVTLTSTLQNHLRVDKPTFELFQQVSRYTKDLYNTALYIQRQRFFKKGTIFPLKKLFQKIKPETEYIRLPSDIGQQILIKVNQNFRSFFKLLKKKKQGDYDKIVRIPNYLDKDDHFQIVFISRLLKIKDNLLRLSLGNRGKQSTGTQYIYLRQPPLGIKPKRIRILPRYKARYFEIDYVYEVSSIPRTQPPIPNSFLSIDLGLDNFATCADITNGTAFIIEGSGIKSFNRWWNKRRAQYQAKINRQGITGSTKRMARRQRYRRNVINNFLNHAVRYIIDYCLDHQIETIIVGDWKDMKNGLRLRKSVGQLFQTLPYKWFRDKLTHKATIHEITILSQEESYTSQDCARCGLRCKSNRVHRGLYRCRQCGLELNADVNGAINIMKKVAPEELNQLQWGSGEITSPSRIRLVEFV